MSLLGLTSGSPFLFASSCDSCPCHRTRSNLLHLANKHFNHSFAGRDPEPASVTVFFFPPQAGRYWYIWAFRSWRLHIDTYEVSCSGSRHRTSATDRIAKSTNLLRTTITDAASTGSQRSDCPAPPFVVRSSTPRPREEGGHSLEFTWVGIGLNLSRPFGQI